MVAMFETGYGGLRKRDTYDQLVNATQPQLAEPDRQAKQLRESPQIANLLDGEGMFSMVQLVEQQAAAAKHQMAEASIREAAGEGLNPEGIRGTAQEMRAAGTQTSKPRLVSSGQQVSAASGARSTQTSSAPLASTATQAWRQQTHSGGTQTDAAELSGALFFDMGVDDKMEDELEGIDTQMAALDSAAASQHKSIVGILKKHMGQEVTPAQSDFAHRLATQASSGGALSSHADPESAHEPKGPRGRPRSYQTPMDTDADPKTSKQKAEESPVPRAKSKARAEGVSIPSEVKQAKAEALGPPITVTAAPAPEAKQKSLGPAKAKKAASASSSSGPPDPAPETEHEPARGGTTKGSGKSQTAPKKGATPRTHGIEIIEGKSKSWWSTQNISVLKSQAELRGHRFSDLDTKGGKVRKDGQMVKVKKMAKAQYLETLLRLLEK